MDNYTRLATENLQRLYQDLPDDLATRLGGERAGQQYRFAAFGRACRLSPEGIFLDNAQPPGVIGILLSLYALAARPEAAVLEPLRAFAEFPDSAPYAGAFRAHTEQLLVPAVHRIQAHSSRIVERLSGEAAPPSVGGDFAFVLRPLPKIGLCYIFYEADDEFAASVTCLYSNNADRFMPLDGLADVGEYTSKRILELITPL